MEWTKSDSSPSDVSLNRLVIYAISTALILESEYNILHIEIVQHTYLR